MSSTHIVTNQICAWGIVGDMTIALQDLLLVRHGHPAVTEAFAGGRLSWDRDDLFGTLPTGLDLAPIIDRATPNASGDAEKLIG